MTRNEISEYPFCGCITRIIPGVGDEDDTEIVVYEGEMDGHMQDMAKGDTLTTSQYIISIPLVIGYDDEYVVPRRGDRVCFCRYEQSFSLIVDNSKPSQLGGVSIYCTRNSW